MNGDPTPHMANEIADDDAHIDPEASPFDVPAEELDLLEAAREWRVARSLETLLEQVNAQYPRRSKRSDGTIGDKAHRARRSDHNPQVADGSFGVVTALDITHDPQNGCDADRIARSLVGSRDPRIKYIIWNRKIVNASPVGGAPAWTWRAYTGSNPHNKHCHVSVKGAKAQYDDTRPWSLPGPGAVETSTADLEEDTEALIASALSALGGSHGKPLLQSLVDAQDAIAILLARHAEAERVRAVDSGAVEAAPPSLDQLRQGYLNLWSNCRISQARAGEVMWHRSRLLKGRARYEDVARRTGAPWWFIGIVHALEASFNFAGHLHNGDPLTARTVQVPRGRPAQWNPPSDWVSSATDAITHDGNAGLTNWKLAETLYRFERYNGFGYRPRGINTPYLWSFSNHYVQGKFVADGKFSPTAVSKQCGAAVMLKALVNAGDVSIDS